MATRRNTKKTQTELQNLKDMIEYDDFDYDDYGSYDDNIGAMLSALLDNSCKLTDLILKYSGKNEFKKEEIFKIYNESMAQTGKSIEQVSKIMGG